MALQEYKCFFCDEKRLAFDLDVALDLDRLQTYTNCTGCFSYKHSWVKQPPRVSVVLATTGLMLDDPQLDSLITIYELDRQLNLEARDAIEMEVYQQARRNT